jgi:hypothetical protein
MRSNLSMTRASFGVIFLSFGLVFVVLGWLGLHFHWRESMGTSGLYGAVFLVIGAVLFGAGSMGRRKTAA